MLSGICTSSGSTATRPSHCCSKMPGSMASRSKGVGISAQGKGLFLLDKQDQPLGNAMLSSDRRALEIVQRWQQDGIPEKLYPHTRQTLWIGHPTSLLRWVKENEPQRYQQIGCVMMAHDYLRWCLTGEKRLRREQHLGVQSLQHEHCSVRSTAHAGLISAKLTVHYRRLSAPQKFAGKSPLRQPRLPVWRRVLRRWRAV